MLTYHDTQMCLTVMKLMKTFGKSVHEVFHSSLHLLLEPFITLVNIQQLLLTASAERNVGLYAGRSLQLSYRNDNYNNLMKFVKLPNINTCETTVQ